jgi:hypothetical protein
LLSAHTRKFNESIDLGFASGFHRLHQMIQVNQEDG